MRKYSAVLLTGQPKVGKTTMIAELVKEVTKKVGFQTAEMLNENFERIGFKLIPSEGKDFLLATTQIKTAYPVGKYFVQIENLNQLLPPLFTYDFFDLLYIDEIGQMELCSDEFKALCLEYINADNLFIGTISAVFDDPFILAIKKRSDVLVLELTKENRLAVGKQLSEMIATLHH